MKEKQKKSVSLGHNSKFMLSETGFKWRHGNVSCTFFYQTSFRIKMINFDSVFRSNILCFISDSIFEHRVDRHYSLAQYVGGE